MYICIYILFLTFLYINAIFIYIEYHVYHLIPQPLLTSKKKEERSDQRKRNAKIKSVDTVNFNTV